jgi:phosphate-selective porin
MFRQGGEDQAEWETSSSRPATFAGRTILRPWDSAPSGHPLRTLLFGFALSAGRVPEGLNGLRGRTVAEETFFERVYVNGPRRRFGWETQWRPGPTSVQGEVIMVSDERRGQGIDDEDLPRAVAQGWYLSGTWLVTGEAKRENIEPRRPFLKGGPGAFELAARIEGIRFGSGSKSGLALPGPRAQRAIEKSDHAWTAGVNWYLNEFIKVQANVIRERREDEGSVLPSGERLWNRTLRVQFAL